MKRMETYQTSISLSEESSQMWSLNNRLEAYLTRVKTLEEDNELLRAEINHLRSTKSKRCGTRKCHEEMMKLRDALDDGHQEMIQAEMDRDCIYQEIEHVKEMCLQERQAQEDIKKELSESKKMLEEEKRAQIWLKERLVQLEAEMEDILNAHEEDKALMEEEISSYSQRLENFRVAPVTIQPVDVEDYAKKLSGIWQGAVEEYKSEVSALEYSLSEAKENLRKVLDENKQCQLQLHNLDRELQSLKERKGMLEELLSKQWLDQQDEEGKLQFEIDTLEKEKQDLREQIAQVLEDRQQLMHLKMSLSLEVATYRSLLEAENTRICSPSGNYKISSSFNEPALEQSPFRKRHTEQTKKAVSRDYKLNANKKPSPEKSYQLSTAPTQYQNVKSTSFTSRTSPVTKEFQKVSSVLKSQSLKYTKALNAKPSTPLPIMETNKQHETREALRKSKVETTSHSYSHGSKARNEETARKEPNYEPVLNKNIYNTMEAEIKKSESLGTTESDFLSTDKTEVISANLKTDILETSFKTVEHEAVSDLVLEKQSFLQVDSEDKEKLQEQEITVFVPKLSTDSRREGFDYVDPEQVTEFIREPGSCQTIYIEKREIEESLENQDTETIIQENAEELKQNLKFTKQKTTDMKTDSFISSEENRSYGTQMEEQVEKEGDLKDEEVTVSQELYMLSTEEESSKQPNVDDEVIDRSQKERLELSDIEQKNDSETEQEGHFNKDTEEITQHHEESRLSSGKFEDNLDGYYNEYGLETLNFDQEAQKGLELTASEQDTKNVNNVEPENKLLEDFVKESQELYMLSNEKDSKQLIPNQDVMEENLESRENYELIDAQENLQLKHNDYKDNFLDEVPVEQQFDNLDVLGKGVELLDSESISQNKNHEEQKNLESSDLEQESHNPEEEQKIQNISGTEVIIMETRDNDETSLIDDDKDTVIPLNEVQQCGNEVSQVFAKCVQESQEEQMGSDMTKVQDCQSLEDQQEDKTFSVTEDIPQESIMNEKEVIDQQDDVQLEPNQLSETVEDQPCQQPTPEEMKAFELSDTEQVIHNVSDSDDHILKDIDTEQVIQLLKVEEVASNLTDIRVSIGENQEHPYEPNLKNENQTPFSFGDAECDLTSQPFDNEQSDNQFGGIKEDSFDEEQAYRRCGQVEFKSSQEDVEEIIQETHEGLAMSEENITSKKEEITQLFQQELEFYTEENIVEEDGSISTSTDQVSQLPESEAEESISGSDNTENELNMPQPMVQGSIHSEVFTPWNAVVEPDSPIEDDADHEPEFGNETYCDTEVKVTFRKESEEKIVIQSCEETRDNNYAVSISKESTLSAESEQIHDIEQNITEMDRSILINADQECQLQETKMQERLSEAEDVESSTLFNTEVKPESQKVDVIDQDFEIDHQGDVEKRISFVNEGEDVSQTSEERESEDEEMKQSMEEESDAEQNIMFSFNVIPNYLRLTSENDTEIDTEKQECSDVDNDVKGKVDDLEKEVVQVYENVEETISEGQDLGENVEEEAYQQSTFTGLQYDQSNIELENQTRNTDPEHDELVELLVDQLEKAGDPNLREHVQEQELLAETPTEKLDSDEPIEQQKYEYIPATNLDEDNSKSDESIGSQEISIYSQKSEEFEISKDYQLEQTLPDTTPLPNLDSDFEDLTEQEVVTESHVAEVSADKVQITTILASTFYRESHSTDIISEEQSGIGNKNESRKDEPEYDEDHLVKGYENNLYKDKQKPDLLDENPSETLNTNEHIDGPEMQLEDTAVARLVIENSESDESINSQDVSVISQKSDELEFSKDHQLQQALPDTTPLSDLDEKVENLMEPQIQITLEGPDDGNENVGERDSATAEGTIEKQYIIETTELVSFLEHTETELVSSKVTDTVIVTDAAAFGLNQELSCNEDSEKGEVIIREQINLGTRAVTLEQTSEQDFDSNKTGQGNSDKDREHNEKSVDLGEHPIIDETANVVLQELNDAISEIQDSITVENTTEDVNLDRKPSNGIFISESEDFTSSGEKSPNANIVKQESVVDGSRIQNTEEINNAVKATESSEENGRTEENVELTETYQGEALSTNKPDKDFNLPKQLESHTSDEEKDIGGESSDSSFDSNYAYDEVLQEHEIVPENTSENHMNGKVLNGLHGHSIVQATLDLEDHIFNGHSTGKHSEIVISEVKTIVKLEGDITKPHTEDIIDDTVFKFASSDGKSEGLFQTLLETSEREVSEGSQLCEASEIKKAIHAALEYVNSAAEETSFTKNIVNPYLSDNEDLVDPNTSQEASESHQAILGLNFKQEKEESWSSDE